METKTRLFCYNRTHMNDARFVGGTADASGLNYNTEPTTFQESMLLTPSPPLFHLRLSSATTSTAANNPSTSHANIVFRNLGDVIASQVPDVLSVPPRHGDGFNQPRHHACAAAPTETGLPNIRTFIDEMYPVCSSAADRLHLYNPITGMSSAISNTAEDGDSSINSRVDTGAPSLQLILDDNVQQQQQHHQHQHQYQYHPHPHYHHHQVSHALGSAFFSPSTVSDRLLQNNVPYDEEDVFFDIPSSQGGVDQVADIDDSVGFLSAGTDALSDASGWGHGLRLFELSSGEGLYDEEMPSLVSINSTPELEGIRKIQSVSSKLGIPSDPMKWSAEDVHTWLSWILSTSSLPCVEEWPFDGVQLCCLGIREFSMRLGSGDTELVMTTLAQWKQLGPAAAGCGVGSGGLLTSPGGDIVSFSYTTLNSDASYQHDHVAFNNNNGPTSSHLCSSNQCSSTTAQRRHHEIQKSQIQHQHSAYHKAPKLDSLSTSPAGNWETPFVSGVHLSQICDVRTLASSSSRVIKSEMLTGSDDFRSTDDSLLYCTSSTANCFSDDLDLQSSICKSWPDSPSTTNFQSSGQHSRSGRGATKRTICLWQFLRELLHQQSYQSWIRWIDRNRGIFKIEDSVRVAKLWGERKNRPAMNYDKLSRSIRQYYKKGIIQKTSNSKRLVYQFCPAYMT